MSLSDELRKSFEVVYLLLSNSSVVTIRNWFFSHSRTSPAVGIDNPRKCIPSASTATEIRDYHRNIAYSLIRGTSRGVGVMRSPSMLICFAHENTQMKMWRFFIFEVRTALFTLIAEPDGLSDKIVCPRRMNVCIPQPITHLNASCC